MKKREYTKALKALLASARKSSWQRNQDLMINAFAKQERERLKLFDDNENVGYTEQLLENAQSFQGLWSYEHNAYLDAIF